MGSKIGLILSLVFMHLIMLFGIDLICIQYVYTSLDSFSTSITFNISRNGYISEDLKNYVYEEYKANLYSLDEEGTQYQYGDTLNYCLEKEYEPLILPETYLIKIKRFAIIKIYN